MTGKVRAVFHLAAMALLWVSGAMAPLTAQTAPEYVGSEACSDCHEDAARAWTGSHHALAWTQATPDTVVADFDGTEFSHKGTLTRFRIENGKYFAKVTESDGTTTDYPIHSVVGIEPLQQYLIETEPGRLQSFDVVWDTEKKQWYHLYPDQDLPPGDGLHWTGVYKNWNSRCAECHATDFERNFGARSGTYRSTQAEIGVGCEACHGPGSAHLAWANGDGLTQMPPGLSELGFSERLDPENSNAWIEQCAGCHSRREALEGGNPLPGTPFAQAYNLALLRPGLYQADGQIEDEVYVYGSFLQSRMFNRGVGCMNCHEPHAAKLKAEGNAVCVQCHSPAGNPDFPTLPKAVFDSPEHHFHPEGSDGALCKNCHMPERVYMGVDGRRDHSFRVPRPDLGRETSSSDACTDCHVGQTRDWAAAQIETWYPDSVRGPHYGQVLAHGRSDPIDAAGSLQELALDREQPGIVRATALYLLPQGDPEAMRSLLSDPDPLVRANAARFQGGLAPQEQAARLFPLLTDPMRSVRIAAAREMLTVDPGQLRPSQAAVVGEAMGEWQRSLGTRLDFPETHLVMGGIALNFRDVQNATGAFRKAVELDPQRVEAWSMLIRLAEATQGRPAAVNVLNEALEFVPDAPSILSLKDRLDP